VQHLLCPQIREDLQPALRHPSLLGVPKIVFIDACAGSMDHTSGVNALATTNKRVAAASQAAQQAAQRAAKAAVLATAAKAAAEEQQRLGLDAAGYAAHLEDVADAAQAHAEALAARADTVRGAVVEKGVVKADDFRVAVGADEFVVHVTVPGYTAATADVTRYFAQQVQAGSRSLAEVMRYVALRVFAAATDRDHAPQIPSFRSTLRYELRLHD